MSEFQRINAELHAEQVPLADLARDHGTPAWVYSRAAITRAWQALDDAFKSHPHQFCYSVKANSNLGVLSVLAELGAGFDIVSGGELTRVLAAGGDPARVVFSGVGKQAAEIEQALEAGIACFNMESATEMQQIKAIAGSHGVKAPVSIRVNPDVDAGTHPYIATGLKENKFGVAANEALQLYQQATEMAEFTLCGIDCHIGSQITEVAPYLQALDRLLELVDKLGRQDIHLDHIDLGGGMGIHYHDEAQLDLNDFADAVLQKLQGRHETLMLEPGRSIIANAGLLLTRVLLLKENEGKHFAVTDAAMNDLLRPALYQAWHQVVKVNDKSADGREAQQASWDLVGPVCETADFLARNRELTLAEDDLLAIMSCGAYGAVMSSNYNSRTRAPEILVDGKEAHLVRRRENLDDLLALESLPSRHNVMGEEAARQGGRKVKS